MQTPISELMARDPLSLTVTEVDTICLYYRSKREAAQAEPKAAKGASKKGASDLEDVELDL